MVERKVILFLALLSVSYGQIPMGDGSDEVIHMSLSTHSRSSNVLASLNVTIENFSKEQTAFKEHYIVCNETISQATNRSERISVSRYKIRVAHNSKTYLYDLNIQTEGIVECRYMPWGKVLARSNTLFVRFGNIQVSVVRLEPRVKVEILQSKLMNRSVRRKSADLNVYHIDSKYITNNPFSDRRIIQDLQKLLRDKLEPDVRIEYVRSTKYCPPIEEFNIPPKVSREKYVSPDNRVLTCVGNFFTGVHWDEQELAKIGYQDGTLTTVEALKIFSKELKGSPQKLSIIANQYENFITDKSGLMMKAKSQNISNELLVNLDAALVQTKLNSSFAEETRQNFAARVEDMSATKSVGVLVKETTDNEQGGGQKFEQLMSETDNEKVMDSSVSAGVRLPESLLDRANMSKRLVVTVFRETKTLFNERIGTTSVVNANLGGVHHKDLEEPIIIWFRRNASIAPGACVFWDFDLKNGAGNWSTEGCSLNQTHHLQDSNYVIDECHCWHMTHFGEIIWNSDEDFFEPGYVNMAQELERISVIGCIVSLVALSAVFVTAAIAPKWLKGIGQKILLQMAISFALLLAVFLVASSLSQETLGSAGCFFVGFILHYAILSNFFWMLVAGYLQYNRLVKVIYSRTTKLLLKASVIGWGIPIIPGAIVLISQDYWIYSQPPLYLPYGWAFYLTIVAPLVVTMALNLFVFGAIIKNLYIMSENEPRKHANYCLSVTRFKQIAFLFALLGLSWIFAICQVAFKPWRLFFAYLFCLTITFKGVFHFVFFVPAQLARGSWRTLLCGGRMLFKMDWGSEHSSGTTFTNASRGNRASARMSHISYLPH